MTGKAKSAPVSDPLPRRVSAIKHYPGKNAGRSPERGRSYGFTHGVLAQPEAVAPGGDVDGG